MSLVTSNEVREIAGVGDDITTDAVITSLIEEVEKKTYSYFNIYSTPTKVIEIVDGNNKNQIRVNKPYIWKLLEFKTGDTDLDISYTNINPLSGIITIDNRQIPYYLSQYRNSVKIKYLSGFMEKTTTITESSADIELGTAVVIAVDDETGFSVDDWVLIEGMDGNREAAKITATGTDEITVDQLVQDHESGSVITKLSTHELLRQFVLLESAVYTSINAIGGSYNFATGYTFPEYTVQKGVPYTHFAKVVDKLDANGKARDEVKRQLHNKLNAIS